MKKTIKIEGMNCGHCTNAVTKALKELTGISEVVVNLEKKEATVELSGDTVSDIMLKEAIEETGFEVVEII